MPAKFLEELKQRQILNNISSEEKFLKIKKGSGVYIGFDPTAKSLHLGNYLQILTLLRFKKAGYKPYAVLGGMTGMIGDPSFRSTERVLLSDSDVQKNKAAIKKQLESFGLTVVDNYDFYKDMSVMQFLREVGTLINVNYLLEKESINTRLENGLTFTELTYQLLQGWDFKNMYFNYDTKIQVGGSDQWGNITTGLEFIRKINPSDSKEAVALTINLLTDENGNKYSKSTGGGALWLDSKMTSPYALYQFLLNVSDKKVEEFLKILTFLDLKEISQIMSNHNEKKHHRIAQKTLAYEVIKDIYSNEIANTAKKISEVLFSKSDEQLNLEDIEMIRGSIPVLEINQKTKFIDLINNYKITCSNRETREFISKKSFSIDGIVIENENQEIEFNNYANKYALLKKGKKDFFILKNKTKN
ncbi:tyrosine--tRNA ligase [Mycoplasma enhydrae]|uniref:tyrosine--tRNA ligase n=1 Tax=Mycoplasma enhydrae TaxID=2499220 RepID=UPI00197B82C5|nr:tyrosine--tRNA ligase [Mycoplasma enhydrae]MBN4089659.1 tyrosine--tRNA ligase [Mycoplasma enhydrae]MCV3733940.1 tyrosine--tRNA ligase [Mycoplasma enhydrae]MCV3753680.1 tyrosine--tRNA ligase [Mycoplasma enhydrae]